MLSKRAPSQLIQSPQKKIKANQTEHDYSQLPLEVLRMIAQSFRSAKDLLHFAMSCKRFHEAGPYEDILLRNFVFSYKKKICMRHIEDMIKNHCLGKECLSKLRRDQPVSKLSKISLKRVRDLYDNHLRQMLTQNRQWKEARSIKAPPCEYQPLQGITLQRHQEEALHFLLDVEKQEPLILHVEEFMPNNSVRVPYFPTNDQMMNYLHERKKPANEVWQETFHLQGGMFCDEQGTGKTLTLVSLIVNHPAPVEFCDEKLPLEFPHTTRSSATLIICPSQIVKQWAEVIKKHAPQLQVHHVLQQSELHSGITRKEIEEQLDVLIVSQAMFGMTPHGRSDSDSRLNHIYTFTFFRIIVDESHEFFKNAVSSCYPNRRLYAKNKWLVSGTPFPTLKHFIEYMKFFHPTNEVLNSNSGCYSFQTGNKYHNIVHIHEFFMKLVWRNYWRTCNSSVECFSDANVEILPHPLIMSEQRKLAYRFTECLLENILHTNTTKRALRALIHDNKLPRELHYTHSHIRCIEHWYYDGYVSVSEDLERDCLMALSHDKKALCSEIINPTPQMNEMLSEIVDFQVVNNIRSVKCKTFPCEYVFDGKHCGKDADRVALWCGGRFCLKHKKTEALRKAGLLGNKQRLNTLSCVKMNSLGEMIRNIHQQDGSRKFLLFFTSAVDMNRFAWYLGDVLELGLRHSICSGNYSRRNKAIRDIKNGISSLMLMSWDKSPSGVDGLSGVISDIVFVDVPHGGNAESSTRQAIARCLRMGRNDNKKLHIHVYYIKDTIQETDYLDNPVFKELLSRQQ